ncbi:MAG TPA: PASTA domain-containing protein, partial [Ktedonobacterales bacterium]|nr:PASTA domain-containing protein [Ktedonobacterales bacterium]
LPGYGPAAFGAPGGRSGPARGPAPASGPSGRRSSPSLGGGRELDMPRGGREVDGPRGGQGFDAPGVFPGMSTRPYGPAGGTEPGLNSPPDWLPQRPDEEGGNRRNNLVVGAVVGGVVLLLLLSCALILPGMLGGLGALGASATPSPTTIIVQVPRFKGMTLTNAQATAQNAKLTIVTTYATPDPNDPNPPAKDQVLDQQPEPGPHTGALTSVTLILSAGPGKSVVPNIIGKDDQTACALLQAAKLTCALQNYEQSNLPANTVTRTDPPAGTSVDPHTPVNYWLSLGPPTPTATTAPTALPTATPTCVPTPVVVPPSPTPTPVPGCH